MAAGVAERFEELDLRYDLAGWRREMGLGSCKPSTWRWRATRRAHAAWFSAGSAALPTGPRFRRPVGGDPKNAAERPVCFASV